MSAGCQFFIAVMDGCHLELVTDFLGALVEFCLLQSAQKGQRTMSLGPVPRATAHRAAEEDNVEATLSEGHAVRLADAISGAWGPIRSVSRASGDCIVRCL